MPLVEVSNVEFAYTTEPVVHGASFSIERGEIVSILGPSGCGKSTLLRLIAGLEIPDTGTILTDGASAGTNRELLRFLFQDYDAYPWYTVRENVELGSGSTPYPDNVVVDKILAQVGLKGSADRYPGELSGGMRKRLGLARCLVRHPALLLLDEPFSSLDIDTKYGMYDLVQRLWRDSGCAVILVTHDLHDAILLSDRILVASPKPMRLCEVINVPFDRPRGDQIYNSADYLRIRQQLTSLLRGTFGK